MITARSSPRHLISAYVLVEPKVLNFGEINVGNASDQLTLELKNVGRRLAQYCIDLGRNDLELIIDPMKGAIMVNLLDSNARIQGVCKRSVQNSGTNS